jgi:hypothetical protein
VTTDAHDHASRPRGILLLWVGLLAAPLAWALHLQVSYMLGTLACEHNAQTAFHLVTAVALLLAAAGGGIAWWCWGHSGRAWPRGEGGAVGRSRFMALSGFILSLVFALAIVAQAVINFILSACY